MSTSKSHVKSCNSKDQGTSKPKKRKLSPPANRYKEPPQIDVPESHLSGDDDKTDVVESSTPVVLFSQSPPLSPILFRRHNSEKNVESPPLSPIMLPRRDSEQDVESALLSPNLSRQYNSNNIIQKYLFQDDDEDENDVGNELRSSFQYSYNQGTTSTSFSYSQDVSDVIKMTAGSPKVQDGCHSSESTASKETVEVKFKNFSFDSVTEALVEDGTHESNKMQNLVNLNVEMVFRHIESKMKLNNLPGGDEEAYCSWKMLLAFLEKPTTFRAITEELLRLQQDDNLVGNSTLYELMEIILELIRKMMQSEYEQRKSIWEGCLKLLS